MSAKTVIDGQIELNTCIDMDTKERVTNTAVLPKECAKDWEGLSLWILNWRINREANTVLLTYQTRNELCAPIHDTVFACGQIRTPILPPSRSKNWVFREYSHEWFNRKTGVRLPL